MMRHIEAWNLYTLIVYLQFTTFENKVSRLAIYIFIATARPVEAVLRKQSKQKHFLQNQTGLKYTCILPAQGKLDHISNEERKEQIKLQSKTSRISIKVETEISAELHTVWLIVKQQLGLDSEGWRQ